MTDEERAQKHREQQAAYHKTDAGKATRARYNKSEKGRLTRSKNPSDRRHWVAYIMRGLSPSDY